MKHEKSQNRSSRAENFWMSHDSHCKVTVGLGQGLDQYQAKCQRYCRTDRFKVNSDSLKENGTPETSQETGTIDTAAGLSCVKQRMV